LIKNLDSFLTHTLITTTR